ncbi:type II toxin-antitoxin system VapC family toxin [Methylobacterium oryzisoli]|uniref:type II toxin-antitoxin system VapC family toxin n=1 Tax=Methylobacterium oryzisoli TaxID=3385502 RepID=UPI003891ADC3
MTLDLRASLRRRKPERRRTPLRRRQRSALPSLADLDALPQPALLLDTNVYIRNAGGTLPAEVEGCLDRALLFHCSVCLSELAAGIAKASPGGERWRALRDHYAAIFEAIPANRLLVPDAAIWAEAGLVAGTLARLQGFQRGQAKECLNDALILLTAAREGLPVLTADHGDFDLIQQLVPEGRFVGFDL